MKESPKIFSAKPSKIIKLQVIFSIGIISNLSKVLSDIICNIKMSTFSNFLSHIYINILFRNWSRQMVFPDCFILIFTKFLSHYLQWKVSFNLLMKLSKISYQIFTFKFFFTIGTSQRSFLFASFLSSQSSCHITCSEKVLAPN